MYVSVLYMKIPWRFAERTLLSPWLQWQHVYTVACVRRWLGLCLRLWPCFMSSQSACSADSFHLTCLSCGFPCAFTQVKFSLRLMYRTAVTPASFPLRLCSEKDLCKNLSDYICPYILPFSGGWYWWDLLWCSGSSYPQSHRINFVNFLTGTTFLISLCSLRSAMTSVC